jgi:hypothetical protein
MFAMEESKKSWEKRIEDIKREYFEVTPNLPRKLKKKRRKKLNDEYSFLISLKKYEETLFNW